MYSQEEINLSLNGALAAATRPVDHHGIMVYMNGDPDYTGPDFMIDEHDEKGIAIFREFAAKMAAHYKSLKSKS